MSIKLELPKITELKPRIVVIGIGGAGCNAINNMIATGLAGVEFIAANTDAQSLAMSSAECRVQLGANLTEGLGAGANPEIGHAAAEEALDEIRANIDGAHMVFLAAGMGGGTGTGAVSVIARAAREMQILTVAIVTKPFQFEGTRRLRAAEAGLAELQAVVDTLIVIPNQNLFRVSSEKTSFAEAFVLADQVLYSGIACIVDLIVKDGLINLDFADVKSVMLGMGAAMMGTGEASGERRAILAAEQAISNPLLDDVSLAGAKGLLVSIIGSRNMTLYDVDAAASRVKQDADPDANIIVGTSFDDSLGDRIRVSIVASGMSLADSQRVRGDGGAGHRGGGAVAFAAGRETATSERAEAPEGPGDPYLGHEKPDDFASALSALIGRAEPPSQEPHSRLPDDQLLPAWEAPDGVTIEDASPRLSQRSAPPPLPASGADRHDRSGSAPQFRAEPPANVRHTVQPIPDIAAFPKIAQREYIAKQGGSGRSSSGEPAAGEGGHPSLFKRLGLFGRSDANDRSGSSDSHDTGAAKPSQDGRTHVQGAPRDGGGNNHRNMTPGPNPRARNG